MPEFQALQCFDCSTFQVQQAKKTGKFACTVCGVKQSIRKVYAASTVAKDVRVNVQRLNAKRQEVLNDHPYRKYEDAGQDNGLREIRGTPPIKWNDYIETKDETPAIVSFQDAPGMHVTTAFDSQAFNKGRKRKAAKDELADGGNILIKSQVLGGMQHAGPKAWKMAEDSVLGREEHRNFFPSKISARSRAVASTQKRPKSPPTAFQKYASMTPRNCSLLSQVATRNRTDGISSYDWITQKPLDSKQTKCIAKAEPRGTEMSKWSCFCQEEREAAHEEICPDAESSSMWQECVLKNDCPVETESKPIVVAWEN